jgi:biotin synthase
MSGIDTAEALELLRREGRATYDLLARAHALRLETRGLEVRLCGVVNAKSGECTEDCKFCAQSAHNDADVDCYPLLDEERLVAAAHEARGNRAARFGIVTSGKTLDGAGELDTVAAAVGRVKGEAGLGSCASLGHADEAMLRRLKEAGLERYHHNLETARSFFEQICTTRDYDDGVDTVRAAKQVGLSTCCGGLFGLGESLAQRVELLETIRELSVDSVPLNFFNPVPGTALTQVAPLEPLECLKVVAVARLMMPQKEIRVCGGREHNLGDLQSWTLLSGADGLMVGGYLTTKGRAVADDLKMISDAGFTVVEP